MSYTEENKNRVITVERLDQFYGGIKERFLTKSDAASSYAGINGNTDNNFDAYQLNATRMYLDDGVMFRLIPASNGGPILEIQGSDGGEETGKAILYLNSGTKEIATLDDIDGKVSIVNVVVPLSGTTNRSYGFSQLPHPQVFTGILGESTETIAVDQLYYVKSGTTYGSLGTITRAGFYAVTGVTVQPSSVSIRTLQFVCIPSRYVLYYNINTNTFYRFSSGTFAAISTGSGTTPIDPPSDYAEATSADIDGIIDNYINNA
jgi:hypothetical protein